MRRQVSPCASRSQCASLLACQIPLKFGLPSIRAGRAAWPDVRIVAMEITEFEITTLDAALFEPPPGMMEMGNLQALTRAVSDANESKLAASLSASAPSVERIAGVPNVGVPEIVNKTAQQVDTRALRERLVSELAELKLNAAPLAAGQADLAQQAGAHGYDYVLTAEITDLKVSKPGGGLGGVLRGAASKVAGTGTSTSDPAEASIAIKLVQPDGKNRYSTTAKGKTGGGAFDVKNMAKSFGTGYLNLMTGRLMMNALNKTMTKNLGGMGVMSDPNLLNMQVQGMNVGPTGGLRGLGATELRAPTDEDEWWVMSDPEGGEFCAFLREDRTRQPGVAVHFIDRGLYSAHCWSGTRFENGGSGSEPVTQRRG